MAAGDRDEFACERLPANAANWNRRPRAAAGLFEFDVGKQPFVVGMRALTLNLLQVGLEAIGRSGFLGRTQDILVVTSTGKSPTQRFFARCARRC